MANDQGDLAFVPFSKFDFEEKKSAYAHCVSISSYSRLNRNHKSVVVVALESDAEPLQLPVRIDRPSPDAF